MTNDDPTRYDIDKQRAIDELAARQTRMSNLLDALCLVVRRDIGCSCSQGNTCYVCDLMREAQELMTVSRDRPRSLPE